MCPLSFQTRPPPWRRSQRQRAVLLIWRRWPPRSSPALLHSLWRGPAFIFMLFLSPQATSSAMFPEVSSGLSFQSGTAGIFSSIHTIAHPGTRATSRLISARFCWKGMATDITAWCRECLGCNRGKVTTQPAAPAQPIPIPCRRFTHVHVDLVGPLPVSFGGFNHIFTMIDRSTRWLEAVPLKDTSATSCADTFVATWVTRYGVPECITSDRGPQFTSAVWSALCSRLGISRSLTTAFHPQSNGMVERAHRQLKDALRARAAGHDWPSHLLWVLLGLRTAPKEDSNISSAELCLGAPLTLPGEFIAGPEPPPQEFVDSLRAAPPLPSMRPRSYAQVAAAPPASLLTAEFVYIRRGGTVPSLQPLYAGPYRVISSGDKCFTVEISGKAEVVSIDRLKPHLGLALIAWRRHRPGAARPSRPLLLLQCRPEDATEGGYVASGKSGSRI
jgi:cleavage and polyadenylation specificity factor subunit 1